MKSKENTKNIEDEIRSVLGEIPNHIFGYLELSEEIKKEWKYGGKASDFGGHNQFVQAFSKRLLALITKEIKQARIDELERLNGMNDPNKVPDNYEMLVKWETSINSRLMELKLELNKD